MEADCNQVSKQFSLVMNTHFELALFDLSVNESSLLFTCLAIHDKVCHLTYWLR